MEKILITGGTGMIGAHLSALLAAQGYEVRHLSRKRNLSAKFPAYAWDYTTQTIDIEAFEGVNTIIHLAGAGIVDKAWTAKYKKEIIDSRVLTTQLLYDTIKKNKLPITQFIATSAVGFYGDTQAKVTDESGTKGKGFLTESCVEWENSVLKVKDLVARVCIIRTGVVFSTKGGALPKLLLNYMVGVGTYFGDGKAFMPWIHINDHARLFAEAIQNKAWSGVYNGSAPQPLNGIDLANELGKGYGRHFFTVSVPAFALKLGLGESAETVLNSSNVVPRRALAEGFEFEFTTVSEAVRDLLRKKI